MSAAPLLDRQAATGGSTTLFAAQPDVPAAPADRERLLRALIDCPRPVVKLRAADGEQQTQTDYLLADPRPPPPRSPTGRRRSWPAATRRPAECTPPGTTAPPPRSTDALSARDSASRPRRPGTPRAGGDGWWRRVVAMSHAVLPPVLIRPVRRLAYGAGVLR